MHYGMLYIYKILNAGGLLSHGLILFYQQTLFIIIPYQFEKIYCLIFAKNE